MSEVPTLLISRQSTARLDLRADSPTVDVILYGIGFSSAGIYAFRTKI